MSTLTVNSQPAAVAVDKERSPMGPMGRCSIYRHPFIRLMCWVFFCVWQLSTYGFIPQKTDFIHTASRVYKIGVTEVTHQQLRP